MKEDNKIYIGEIPDDFDDDIPPYFAENVFEDFAPQIIKRGENYYNNGNVVSCIKTGDNYYAKVSGSYDNFYEVSVYTDDDVIMDYECTCPCDYPCKHIYATLLAIDNHEYITKELKPYIHEEKVTMKELIEKIPASELKNYLMKIPSYKKLKLNLKQLEEHFIEYLPKQTYEYYYNNLYNASILQSNFKHLLKDYLIKIKRYIEIKDYNESFKIIKSIVTSINDAGYLNYEESIINLMLKIGVYMRTIYRKCNNDLKVKIDKWFKELADNNFCEHIYLEDIVQSI